MRMISENEQEHLDHVAGSASEPQNCLSEARSSLSHHNAGSLARINRALQSGAYVVVSRGPWFCKATDGLAGEAIDIEAVRDDRAEAGIKARELSESFQGELDVYVLPRFFDPSELAPQSPVDNSDCPF
jgi:hypothetical protein